MATIRNINERYGDPVLIEGDTVEDAVAALQAGLRTCGPEFADIVVTEDDYEIVEEWQVGDTFWQAEMWRDSECLDNGEPRRTAQAASEDAWGLFHDCSPLERRHAKAWATEWKIGSIEDGSIGDISSTGRTVPMSQWGEAEIMPAEQD